MPYDEDDDTITIYGDTETLDLMSDINEALAEHGLKFEDISSSKDATDHIIYQLTSLENEETDDEG